MKASLLALLSSSVLLACGGASAGGVPDNCEVRVDGVCYPTDAEGCEAAGCPADRCIILESYPGQVQCEEEPAAETTTGDDEAAPLAEGDACDPSSECGDGLFCDGPEGCDVQWTCQPARACTRDLVPYCSCDGETFSTSGNCAGRPYAHRGACEQ